MGWEELTASIVESVAWPVSALVLGVLFRAELKGLLRRLTSMKLPGGTAATFATDLDRGEVYVERAKRDLPKEVLARRFELETAARDKAADGSAPDEGRADDGPAARVIVAWTQFERDVVALYKSVLPKGTARTTRTAVKDLVTAGVLSPDFAQAFYALQDLRNRVAHGELPNKASAQMFAQNASDLGATVLALIPDAQ